MADASEKEDGGEEVKKMAKEKLSQVIRLDPELEALIVSASEKSKKRVDSKLLKKTLEAVKDYLRQDVESNVLVLLNYKKFLPFFVNCLKDNSNSSSIKFNAAWVLETILSNGYVTRVEELVSRDYGVIPLFVKLLHHPDRTIYEKVTAVMVRLSLGNSTRPQLLDISSSVFMEFSKLLKSKKPSDEFVINCAKVVCGLLKGSNEDPKVGLGLYHTSVPVKKKTADGDEEDEEETVDRIAVVQVLPSQRLVKNALPVISLLLDSQDYEIQLNMLHCLIVACSALENVKALVDSGCAPKLAAFFAHSEQTMVVGAIIAVGSIAALTDFQLLAFIKALRGTGELKNYYRVFRLALDFTGSKSVHLAINIFMAGVFELMEMCEQDREIIPAIVESGMINSLMEGVKDKDVREDWQDLSLAILGKLLCHSPEEGISFIGAQILPRVVEILGKTSRNNVKLIMRCSAILATLVKGNLERRDWAVTRLDAVDCVIDCLEELQPDELRTNYNLTYCLYCMLDVKPYTSLDYYKRVPKVMRKLLVDYPEVEKNRINALNVLGLLVSQEKTDAVQMIIDADLIPILVSFVDSSSHEIRARAVDIVFHMSLGTLEQRKCLLKGGLLEKFENIFTRDTCVKTRRNALMTLYVFLKYRGTVKEDQQMIKNKLRIYVEQEIIWNVPETVNSAQKVMDCILKIK